MRQADSLGVGYSVVPYGLFNGDQDVVVEVPGRLEVLRGRLEANLQDLAFEGRVGQIQ